MFLNSPKSFKRKLVTKNIQKSSNPVTAMLTPLRKTGIMSLDLQKISSFHLDGSVILFSNLSRQLICQFLADDDNVMVIQTMESLFRSDFRFRSNE